MKTSGMISFVGTINPNMDSLELCSISNLGPIPKGRSGGAFVACALKLQKTSSSILSIICFNPFHFNEVPTCMYVSIISSIKQIFGEVTFNYVLFITNL